MSKFLSEEDELKKFPTTDKQFTDGGGIIWTPRELSDTDLENSVVLLNYQLKHKTAKRGARTELTALVAEQMRREIRRNGGIDPEIGKDNAMLKAKREVMEKVVKEDSKNEELIVEVRTASGEIWGRTTLRPCRFTTGSAGYKVADRYRDPKAWTAFQFNANLVRIGSRPLTTLDEKSR